MLNFPTVHVCSGGQILSLQQNFFIKREFTLWKLSLQHAPVTCPQVCPDHREGLNLILNYLLARFGVHL